MEKLLMFLVICVFAKAEYSNHTKHLRAFEDYEEYERSAGQPPFQKLPCTSEINVERYNLFTESQCGPPRKVFFDLNHIPRAAHEEVHPSGVWINQCIGLCDGDGPDFKCKPGIAILRHIPVKIIDTITMKEACAAYTIEEPQTCTCCQDSKDDFCKAKGKVLVARKCACNCPNQAEKRECLAKNLQWDRDKCTCAAQARNAPYYPTTAAIFRRTLGAGEEEFGLLESEDLQK